MGLHYAYGAADAAPTKTNETNVFPAACNAIAASTPNTSRHQPDLWRGSLATNCQPSQLLTSILAGLQQATTASCDSADRITGTGHTYDALAAPPPYTSRCPHPTMWHIHFLHFHQRPGQRVITQWDQHARLRAR